MSILQRQPAIDQPLTLDASPEAYYCPSPADWEEYCEWLASLPEPEPTEEEIAEFCEPTPWPAGEEPPF